MNGDIDSLLKAGAETLTSAGIPEPRREAAALLAWAMKKDRAFLIAHPELIPPEDEAVLYLEYLTRRATREPFHYITGTKEFYGLDFNVSPAVLIPRPETEMLVEDALDFLDGRENARFCEVGVGSGCISIAILANSAKAKAVGLEISEEAIEVARVNAAKHKVTDRFEVRRSDVFEALDQDERFDLIVSNPPYIPAAEFETLDAGVRDFEPPHALTDGGDGLSIIRQIINNSPEFLNANGRLSLEIGHDQADRVIQFFDADIWQNVEGQKDFQGIRRVVSAILRS